MLDRVGMMEFGCLKVGVTEFTDGEIVVCESEHGFGCGCCYGAVVCEVGDGGGDGSAGWR